MLQRDGVLQRRVDRELLRLTLVGTALASLVLAVVVVLVEWQVSQRHVQDHAQRTERELLELVTSGQSLDQVRRQVPITAAAAQLNLAVLVNQTGHVIAADDAALIGERLARPMLMPISDADWEGIVPCLPTSNSVGQRHRCQLPFRRVSGLVWPMGGDRLISVNRTRLAFPDRPGLEQGGLLVLGFDLSDSLQQAYVRGLLTLTAGSILLVLTGGSLVAVVRRRLVRQLVQLARIDSITGLLNRDAWLEEIGPWLTEQASLREPVLLAIVGLDQFKDVNARHGLTGGDRVLSQVSEMLRREVGAGEWLAHLSGDQFVLCLRGGTAQVDCLRSLCRGLAAQVWHPEPGHTVRLSCSVGVACSSGPAGWNLNLLMAQADRNLHLAKQHGGNQVMNR